MSWHAKQQAVASAVNTPPKSDPNRSESGKMVMSMFARIREILDDGDGFVCVLIDEVESLTAAR